MNLTYELFRGKNLVLNYDRLGASPPDRLYLGSDGQQWYFIDLEAARRLRDALEDGIVIMEGEN